MKIISLVENRTKSDCMAKHGLSLYIETKTHKILFDLGSDNTLFENAVKRNIDISKPYILWFSLFCSFYLLVIFFWTPTQTNSIIWQLPTVFISETQC